MIVARSVSIRSVTKYLIKIIHIFKLFSRFGEKDGLNANHIFMEDVAQDLEFSESSFGKYFMLKCFFNLFDGDQLAVAFFVVSSHDDTVSTLTNLMKKKPVSMIS